LDTIAKDSWPDHAGHRQAAHPLDQRRVDGVFLSAHRSVRYRQARLFIAGLAFSDQEMYRSARLSVVVGSLLSAVGGAVVLWWSGRRQFKTTGKQLEPFLP
tara:strand:+ start:15765 stop:16067 length:303 start_codon:yes stop_codon:yes gene_type:complete